jgi:hypothetical protein
MEAGLQNIKLIEHRFDMPSRSSVEFRRCLHLAYPDHGAGEVVCRPKMFLALSEWQL